MFKVGDKVKRVAGRYGGMGIGDIGTVYEVNPVHGVRIREYDLSQCHSTSNLVKVSQFKGNK